MMAWAPITTTRKIIIMALAATSLLGATSVGHAGYRNDTDDPSCAYVWSGLARMPSCQMLAPVKSGEHEEIPRSKASLEKTTR
jgi:hypothetical protein